MVDLMNRIDNIFNIPVLTAILNINVDSLTEFCYSCKEKDKVGRRNSNRGGWQSKDIYENASHKELQKLIIEIEKYSQQLHNDVYNFKKEIVQKITNIWININKKNDRNQLHVHPDAIFSGVFYVKTPKDNNGGHIQFINPANLAMTLAWPFESDEVFDSGNSYNSPQILAKPSPNELLIFPAWLQHQVNEHYEEEDRISLSFNTDIRNYD